MKVEESLNVTFDETPPSPKTPPLEDDELVEEEAIEQSALAISTTEAEYLSAGKVRQQVLWMKQALVDYGVRLDDIPIMCDNKGAIDLSIHDIMFSVYLCAHIQEDPKTYHLEAVKRIFRYIKGTTHLGLWYPKGSSIETIVYVDSDHVGDYVDRKSTSGVCTFIGCFLTFWFLKKQSALAISTTEAEYVSAGKVRQQVLWMKQALVDYGVRLDDIPIMCDNKGAIDLSKNLVQHSRTKHIEIRHHFLRDNVQKGNISIEKPNIEQLTVPIHISEDQVVLGETSLSFSLSVSHSRVEQIGENISAEYTSASIPAATVTTTTLSTTFASTSSIPPITVDDYEIMHADGQESPRRNVQWGATTVEFEKEDLDTTPERDLLS
nr:copia protein [Tanacetum cinerariifolium]